MRTSIPAKRFPLVRSAAAAVLLFSELTMAGWFTAGWAGQDPSKPVAQQGRGEPDKTKQPGRKPKEEVEETVKPPRKVPLRVGDEDLNTNQPSPAVKSSTVPPADLKLEAKRARHPAVQDLLNALAEPHDVVTMAQSQRVWNVEPIGQYINPKSEPFPKVTLRVFDAEWKQRQSFSASGKEILGIEPYERLAVRKVDEFLKSGLDQNEDSKQYLPRLEMLREAEKILGAVLLFHDSAMERGLRKGTGWNELRKLLVAKLQEVQLNQLRTLTEQKDWEAALELGSRLAETYPGQKELQVQIIRLLAKSARDSFKNKSLGLRSRLNYLEAQFPNSPELEPIRIELRRAAEGLLKRAQAEEKQGKTQEAIEHVKSARDIYPELPGLHDFYLRLNNKNPILYVGVHDLPEYLSPATAFLDSEKQAVELLFESLIRPTYSPKMGLGYQPCLAADLPKMVPLGRRFSLTQVAYWSDGSPVTAADVRSTVQRLCEDKARGYISEWAELLNEGARIEGDSYHISLTLHRGYLDPLSLMDFKVLPQSVKRADDLEFARKPIGSGPYQLEKRDANRVIFIANPYYERRPGKTGLPRIREIHFVRSDNPVSEFQDDHLQLLLDLPTSRYKVLDSTGLANVKLKTLPNRRIYFLAVNHRKPPLDSQPLRRAIALAIHRDAILDQCFREGRTPPPHRPLNGPYPPGSWAYNPDPKLPADLYHLDLAKAQAKKATEGRAVRKLTLKYPKGDPDVQKACEMIRDQVQQLGVGIDLELSALEPRELQHHVEDLHDFDLAYYSWDYPDETYWLWPLLDPQATKQGGRNFLGYQNDATLQSLFRTAMGHRDPAEVKRLTHQIHEVFTDKMPFIPLWQLDRHLAIHNSLSMEDGRGAAVDPDPLRIFTNVETWTLEKR